MDFHQKLAHHLGAQYAKAIEPRLSEIIAAVEGEQRAASFSVTAEFKPQRSGKENPEGDLYRVSLKPRLRTPDEAIEIDLKMVDGQLSLYAKPDAPPASPNGNGSDAGPTQPGA